MTKTFVPTSTLPARSITSSLSILKHPCEAHVPTDARILWLVPWMGWEAAGPWPAGLWQSACASASASAPIGLLGAPPAIVLGMSRMSCLAVVDAIQAGQGC